ncbi:hypothetical protein [Actinopolymorpha pittospori]|uniref:Two-component system sensor histidine kinase KdpD n=1 Tax=Actinopolymorpha pittospori TaxID=648752 RepID=A0A927MUK2_9ACTN|nr:hypothetical protein [Actinopolymorpha pittospori]MBE1606479.1 two-component system sensor histidine kinase KdpD [Actinopolymorpha pittospori]
MAGWIDNADGSPTGSAVATTIAQTRAGLAFEISGVIGATRTITVGRSQTYCCTLVDGTGKLDLLFLGRATVHGLRTDIRCAVSGRAAMRAGRLVAWDPRFRLDPAPPGERPDLARAEEEHGSGTPPPVQAALRAARRAIATQPAGESGGAGGRLRIYLGAAPGVGKTYAMLDEGQVRRGHGGDVVIAVVESHGRPAIQAQAAGLETVPRKSVEYRGSRFEELDLEAVLTRRPGVALVDELAHSNVPGSGRNEKRWQDVLELLAAGIDVITTVNVQHIQGLTDAVEELTGLQIREHVPDSVLRSADEIELVDSSPEQLRRRMSHGDIYAPDVARRALDGFFQTDTLTALRDLALRFLAEEGEDGEDGEGEAPRRSGQAGLPVGWEAIERVLVGVAPTPGTDVVLRRVARIANRCKADLHVAYVIPTGAGARHTQIERLRDLAHDLGAQWSDLYGDDPATALLDFAASQRITQIVVLPSRRTLWREILSGGSTVARLSRLADRAGIDVHILATTASPADAGR